MVLLFGSAPIDTAFVEDHAIIVESPANMRRLLALLSSIVHAILTHDQPKNIISQAQIRELSRRDRRVPEMRHTVG